jgi:hypothetical protein
MKRRKNKKNGIIAAVVALSGVSLVSVGFASWIISGGDTANVEGNIQADQATDKRFLIQLHDDYKTADSKVKFVNNIVYGPKTETTTYTWLTYDGSLTENLSATAKFWVANIEDGTAQDSTNKNILKKGTESIVKMYALSIDSDHTAAFNKEVDSKRLFGALPTPELTVNRSVTKSDFGDSLTYYEVTATVTFTWGAYFGGNNPYKYFNNQAYTTELGTTAKTVLDFVYALNGAKYTTTIKTGSLID